MPPENSFCPFHSLNDFLAPYSIEIKHQTSFLTVNLLSLAAANTLQMTSRKINRKNSFPTGSFCLKRGELSLE